MARNKLPFYRIQTPCKYAQFFDHVNKSDSWKTLVAKGGPDKNFGVDATGRVRIAEEKFTETMAIEAWVDETDKDGVIDVEFEDKEKAKFIMKQLRCFAGLPGAHAMNKMLNAPDDNDKALMEQILEKEIKFYKSLLHPDSPQDIVEELVAEARAASRVTPQTKYAAAVASKKEQMLKEKERLAKEKGKSV